MCFFIYLLPFSRLIRLRDIRRDVDPGGGWGGGGGRVVVLSCDVVCVFPLFFGIRLYSCAFVSFPLLESFY